MRNVLILFIGVLLLFASLYLFTRPVWFDGWNFSETGQIGDTIGGITSPIIGLIGAVLVYITFKEQVKANKIQIDALKLQADSLKEEKERLSYDELYQRHLLLFEDIKIQLRELEFVVSFYPTSGPSGPATQAPHIIYKGISAIDEYVKRFEQSKNRSSAYYNESFSLSSMLLNINFMLTSVEDLIERINDNINRGSDKEFFLKNIKLFYNSFLSSFALRILNVPSNNEPDILELRRLKDAIDLNLKN